MGIFETLTGFLKGSVGNNHGNDPEDVLNVKRGLSQAGYFDMDQAPEPHGYITKEMDEGIRQFQKDKGLRVDGYMLLGGETENALRQSQTARPADGFSQPAQSVDATGRVIRDEPTSPPPPIPPRKPNFSVIPDLAEPPAYRHNVFKEDRPNDWAYWTKKNADDPDLNGDMKYAFDATFGAEGGFAKASKNGAYAGITKTSLADAIARVEGDKAIQAIARKYGRNPDPEQLSRDEIHQAYKSVLDATMLSAYKGKKKHAVQLLGDLGDRKITAAVTDTFFRNGSGEGAQLIQKAINATRASDMQIEENGGFGSKTYDALKEVAQNPRKHRMFLDTLTKGRMASKTYDPREGDRMLFYQFPNWNQDDGAR